MEPTYQTCIVCGSPFPVRSGGPGRRREYCSDDCRMLRSAMGTCAMLLQRVAPHADPSHWKAIRGELWSMANVRSWQRPR